jgi:hypothetical protein
MAETNELVQRGTIQVSWSHLLFSYTLTGMDREFEQFEANYVWRNRKPIDHEFWHLVGVLYMHMPARTCEVVAHVIFSGRSGRVNYTRCFWGEFECDPYRVDCLV